MTLPTIDPASRIWKLLDQAEPAMREALYTAVASARDALTLRELEELILLGLYPEALDRAAEVAAVKLAEEYALAYTLAGVSSSGFLQEALGVNIAFNQVNQGAVEHMESQRLGLIREFTDQQRKATRAALADGIARGLNPKQQALNFRESIGLTEKQVKAIQKYRQLLLDGDAAALSRSLRDRRFDRTVQGAIRDGQPLTPAQVDRMVERYSQRYLKYRANVIGRTEALRSVHSANHEAYLQAVESSHITMEELSRVWRTASDSKVRDTHSSMEGQKVVGLLVPFESAAGVRLLYPGDPRAPAEETIHCRCAVETRLG